jgi:hypothetical protein
MLAALASCGRSKESYLDKVSLLSSGGEEIEIYVPFTKNVFITHPSLLIPLPLPLEQVKFLSLHFLR